MMLRPTQGIRNRLRRRLLSTPVRFALLAFIASLIAVGCAEGSYPVDIFYEMHYQPSHHSQQPPRLMPPAGAVPITGKDVPLFAQYHPRRNQRNPEPHPRRRR